MQELIKSSYKMSMIYSVLFAIIGLLLFIDPSGFVVLVSYMIGILLLVVGINNVLSYSKNRDLAVTKTLLIVGVVLFIVGLFLILEPTFIGKIVPAVIGVCLIINALEKLMYLQYLEDKKSEATGENQDITVDTNDSVSEETVDAIPDGVNISTSEPVGHNVDVKL